MNAEASIPGSGVPDAKSARADRRVAQVLYRTALEGDRWAVVTTLLGALFVASVVAQEGSSHAAWLWCTACVVLAGLRLLVSQPRLFGKSPPQAPDHRGRWLALLFVTSAIWGAGPSLFLLDNPSTDTLLTGILLAAAGLLAPLLAASRPAVYLSLLPALVPLVVALALGRSAPRFRPRATRCCWPRSRRPSSWCCCA